MSDQPNLDDEDLEELSSARSPDPYLRAFIRQSTAILATNRGFNDGARTKILELAKQLGISGLQLTSALEKLKSAHNGDALNRYESEFVAMLTKKLTPFRGDVLKVGHEKQLIKIASRKFQIDETRAHRLIQKTTDELNVGLISSTDAEQFAFQLIRETIGSRVNFPNDERTKLVDICENWGVDPETTEYSIKQKLANNRTALSKQRFSRIAAVVIALPAISFSIWGLTSIDWSSKFAPKQNSPSESVDQPQFPRGWSAKMRTQARQIATERPTFKPLIFRLAEDFNRSDFRQFSTKLANENIESETPFQFLTSFTLSTTAKNKQSILDQLERHLHFENQASETSVSPRWFRRQMVYAKFLRHLYFSTTGIDVDEMFKTRITRLCKRLSPELASTTSPSGFDELAEASVTFQQWQMVLHIAAENEKATIAVLRELEDRKTGIYEPAIQVIRNEITIKLLTQFPYQWNSIRGTIKQTIAALHPHQIKDWKMLIDSTTGNLNHFLIDQLGRKLGIQVERLGLHELKQRIDSQLGPGKQNNARISKSQKHRLKEELRRRLNSSNRWVDTPSSTKEQVSNYSNLIAIVRLNNLLLTVVNPRSEARKQIEPMIDHFEKTNQFPILEEFASKNNVSPSIRRKLERAIQNLSQSDPQNSASRKTSVRQLASATEVEDLSLQQSRILARYVLGVQNEEEFLAIDRAIESFGRWPSFLEAMSEQIENIDRKNKRANTILAKLGDSESAEEVGEHFLLSMALRRRERLSVRREAKWYGAQIEKTLKELLKIRCGLSANSRKTNSVGYESTFDLAEELIQKWNNNAPEPQIRKLRYVENSPMSNSGKLVLVYSLINIVIRDKLLSKSNMTSNVDIAKPKDLFFMELELAQQLIAKIEK